MHIGLVFAMTISVMPAMTMAEGTALDCAGIWGRLVSNLDNQLTGTIPRVEGGQCHVSNLRLADWAQDTVMDEFVWSGTGFDRFIAEGLPPTALSLQVTGLRFVQKTEDPVINYMLDQQTVGFGIDGTANMVWDAAKNRLQVTAFTARFPDNSSFDATLAMDGIDLTSVDSIMASLPTMTITELSANITTVRFFETYLLGPVVMQMLADSLNPEADVKVLRGQAIAAIAGFPNAVVPAASRQALTDLVIDLPHPQGRIQFAMARGEGTPGLPLPSFIMNGLPMTVEAFWQALGGVRLDISYDRTGG